VISRNLLFPWRSAASLSLQRCCPVGQPVAQEVIVAGKQLLGLLRHLLPPPESRDIWFDAYGCISANDAFLSVQSILKL